MVGRQPDGCASSRWRVVKILHVAASYLPAVRYGGTIVSVHGLCRALAARGHDVHVLTTNVNGATNSDVPLAAPVAMDGVTVWYFPSRFVRRLYWSPPMARTLEQHIGEYAIAHLHAMFVWPTWAAARAAHRAKVPYLFAPRGMLEQGLVKRRSRLLKSAWIRIADRRSLEQAAGIHVTSAREATEAKAFGFALPPIYEVPNGVSLEDGAGGGRPSAAIAAITGGRPYVLFLGRINWKKGLDRLVAALPRVPGVRLVVAGNDEEGYRAIVDELAAAAGVSGRLVFVGPVLGADKAMLLRHAQLLVVPSYSENFGNVVIEAMAAGCPVIVTPEVGSAAIVKETGSGWVVPGDAAALSHGISTLLADAETRRRMREAGRAASVHYAWSAVAKRMETVYEQVLRGGRE